METLAEAKAALHQSCDFIMKNFELRQSARDEEMTFKDAWNKQTDGVFLLPLTATLL